MPFERVRGGKFYRFKQIEVYSIDEGESVLVSEEINVDPSPDGLVHGIELLNAREQLIKVRKISFTDASTGKAFELELAT